MVECNGLRLSVRDWRGGSPAILALHGLASNARWWDLVAKHLTPEHRLVSVDQRGHGRSDKPESGYDFETVAQDLRCVVEKLGLGKVVVAGHSWGASVALQFGVSHPDLTCGVICVDGGSSNLADFFGPSWEQAEEAMRPPQFSGLTSETVGMWVEHSRLAEGSDPETTKEILLGNFVETDAGDLTPALSLDRHMEIARNLYHLDPYALMQQIAVPVLLIPASDGDDSVNHRRPGIERASQVLGDRGSVVWIEGIHDLPVQKPSEVAKAIASFLPLCSTGI